MAYHGNAVVVTSLAMTGAEVSYEVPEDVLAIEFQAEGGAITMATTSAGATINIADAASKTIQARTVQKQTFYFIGGAAAVLKILYVLGTGS